MYVVINEELKKYLRHNVNNQIGWTVQQKSVRYFPTASEAYAFLKNCSYDERVQDARVVRMDSPRIAWIARDEDDNSGKARGRPRKPHQAASEGITADLRQG